MDFQLNERVDPEEFTAAMIEALKIKGWTVPPWITTKCHERLSELRARGFRGRFSVSFEMCETQVADVEIIEGAS
jgi:hypothetical protein